MRSPVAGATLTSVPFSIGNVFGGFGIAKGVLRRESDDLVLEFQLKDGVLGLLRSDVRTIRIPIGSIEEIGLNRVWSDPLHLLRKGTWQLRVRTMHLRSVVDVPGHEEDGFRLTVLRKYRRVAQALLSEVDLRMVEIRLRQLESMSKDEVA